MCVRISQPLQSPGSRKLEKNELERESSRHQEREKKKSVSHRKTGETEDNSKQKTKQSGTLILALREGDPLSTKLR